MWKKKILLISCMFLLLLSGVVYSAGLAEDAIINLQFYNWSQSNDTLSRVGTTGSSDPFTTSGCYSSVAGCITLGGGDSGGDVDFTVSDPKSVEIAEGIGNFTIMGWVYIDSAGNGNTHYLVAKSGTDVGIRLYVYSNDNWAIDINLDDDSRYSDNSVSITTNTWQQVVLIKNETAGKVYFKGGTSVPGDLFAVELTNQTLGVSGTNDRFEIGHSGTASNDWYGSIQSLLIVNRTVNDSELQQHLDEVVINLTADPGGVSFADHSINNTAPAINDTIEVAIDITGTNEVDYYIFRWDNGTGTFINDSPVYAGSDVINASVNKTIEVAGGITIQYKWWANDTSGVVSESNVFTVFTAGSVAPNVTINPNNFFVDDNRTFIANNEAANALLNLTFMDEANLFGFVFNITDPSGSLVYNLTATNISGTVDNYTGTIDVTSSLGGQFNVSVEVVDDHTARNIRDFDFSRGMGWLEFEGVRISAEGAVWASTNKYADRYDFNFRYVPLLAPKTKVFFVESENELFFRQDSEYKAHFVDFDGRKWIDFEGVEGTPLVTQFGRNRYRVEIVHSGSFVKFNSIGGLNSQTFNYFYQLTNTSISLDSPVRNTFMNDISASFRVDGTGRNTTYINLYNSSDNLISTTVVSNAGDGAYFYNASFTDLSDHTYKVNATHTETTGINITSDKTALYYQLRLTNDSSYGALPAINFTVRDEISNSRIDLASVTGTFTYNGSSPIRTYNVSELVRDNFTVYLWPPYESVLADYDLTVSAPDYEQRGYAVEDLTLSNSTQSVTLFLLGTADGIFANFRVVDSLGVPVADVLVSYTDEGDTEVVESGSTDDSGAISFFVNPLQSYDFTFSKSGYVTVVSTLTITDTEARTVTLVEESAEQVSYATGIDYFFLPSSQTLNNNTNYTFVFNLTSSFWNISACTLRLVNSSDELAQVQGTTNGSLCEIITAFNTGNQTQIISRATWVLNNTINDTAQLVYKIANVYEGQFSLKNLVDDISSFSGAAFNSTTRFIIAFLITLGVVGAMAFAAAAFREPEVLIMLTLGLVFLFSYFGWFTLTGLDPPVVAGTPVNFLNQYFLFIIMIVGGGGYLIRRHL